MEFDVCLGHENVQEEYAEEVERVCEKWWGRAYGGEGCLLRRD